MFSIEFCYTGRHPRGLHSHLHGPPEGLLRHAHRLGEGQRLEVETGEGDDEAVPRAQGVARVRHGVRRRLRRGENLRSALPGAARKTDRSPLQVGFPISRTRFRQKWQKNTITLFTEDAFSSSLCGTIHLVSFRSIDGGLWFKQSCG